MYYEKIEKLLHNNYDYPAISFYNLIENALRIENTTEKSLSAALHIWRHFKDIVPDKERNDFFNTAEKYEQGRISLNAIKKVLWNMAYEYQQSHLLKSYYFLL
jgi:UV DNA damage endonuclease